MIYIARQPSACLTYYKNVTLTSSRHFCNKYWPSGILQLAKLIAKVPDVGQTGILIKFVMKMHNTPLM